MPKVFGQSFLDNPWRGISPLRPIKVKVISEIDFAVIRVPKFSVIIPSKNEIKSIGKFLGSLMEQTLKPTQILFVDGFSTDGTWELLLKLAEENPLVFVVQSNAPPGKARNEAWRNVSLQSEYIVFMDVGCDYSNDYCKSIVSALELNQDYDVACCAFGFIGAENTYESGQFIQDFQNFSESDWDEWLPSIRGFGLRNSMSPSWPTFPEWVDFAGDDTLFDIQIRNLITGWVVLNPVDPLVKWHVPPTREIAERVMNRYWFGDGQTGARDDRASYLADDLKETFNRGLRTRPEIDRLRRNIRDVMIIYSLTSLGDSGGAHRPAQLAAAFTRKGIRVIFVSLTITQERISKNAWFTGDVSLLTCLSISNPLLTDCINGYLDMDFKIKVLYTAPHKKFVGSFESITNHRAKSAVDVIYDVIDDFSPAGLNSEWYETRIEAYLCSTANVITCVTSALATVLNEKFMVQPLVLANGFNPIIFPFGQSELSLPEVSNLLLTYSGALWGAWFDWECLEELGSFEGCEIDLYGDPLMSAVGFDHRNSPSISFKGLVPQQDLADVYRNSHALLIPFRKDDFSKTISPLKLFEYLQMDRPILLSGIEVPVELHSCTHINLLDSFIKHSKSDGIRNALKKVQAEASTCPLMSNTGHSGANSWDEVIDIIVESH